MSKSKSKSKYRSEISKALSEKLEELSLRDILSRRDICNTKAIYAIKEIKKMIEEGIVIRVKNGKNGKNVGKNVGKKAESLDSTYIIKLNFTDSI